MTKLTVKQTIEKYSNENGFAWGIETVIDAVKPDIQYDISMFEGNIIIDKWESKTPSSQDLKDEYIRQQTIAECIEYYEEKSFFKKIIKKLFKILNRKS
jgi:hypothetical protein